MQRSKTRLDQLLVESGLAENRQKAHALILAGRVFVDSQKVEKQGALVSVTSTVRVRPARRFVGRGGEKLEAALRHFRIDVGGRVCVDLGTSTGGFVDCLLQHGASRVYAFDVGRGQIAWSLAKDPRVALRDRCNVRYLKPEDIPVAFLLMSVDLSFISLRVVLPAIAAAFREKAERGAVVLLLVKPQFELPPDRIAEGGLVMDPQEGRDAVDGIVEAALGRGFVAPEIFPSPLKGAEGNQEYFVKLCCT